MGIAENIQAVRERIAAAARRGGRSAEEVTLVAVSKGHPADVLVEAEAAGLRHFGENRVGEAEAKAPDLAALRGRISLHMIGHLQTNKAGNALHLFDIIHSVDSVRLGEALDRRAERPVPVFLEVNVSGEAAKHGFRPEETPRALERLSRCPNLRVRGLMTMAPAVVDPQETRPVFSGLRELGARLGLRELSMGMTNDFEVAVEEGATMVRIGTAIFGARPSRESA